MLKVGRSRLRGRLVLMDLARRDLRSRAEVQSSEDSVAQKERTHEEER